MRKILLLCLTACSLIANAQVGASCKVLTAALPNMPQYKKFKMLIPPNCDEALVGTYYSFGTHSDQLLFTVMLTDTKPLVNRGTLGDAEVKYDMAKASKDQSANKVSRFKLGAKSWVAHDVNEGIKRVYGYKTILKNRYVLDVRVNDPALLNLDQFQDFIADYLSKFNENNLPN